MVPRELLEFAPLALAGVVWFIEYLGHQRKAPWVTDLGLVLGRDTETLRVDVPLPVPLDWLDDHEIVSHTADRIAFKPPVSSDASVVCIGVIEIARVGEATIFRYRCLLRASTIAFVAAVGSTYWLNTRDLRTAIGIGVAFGLGTVIYAYFQKRKTDDAYHLITADLVQKAQQPG